MHRWLGGCLVLIIANLALAQTGPLVPQELLDQLQASEPQGLPRNMTPQEALLPLPTAERDGRTPPSGTVYCPPEYVRNEGIFMNWKQYTSLITQMIVPITTQDPEGIVHLVVDSPSAQSSAAATLAAAGADLSRVNFIVYQTNAVWIRDYGPRYILEDGAQTIIDHVYNRPRPLDDGFNDFLADYWDAPQYDIGLVHGGGNFHLFANGDAFMTTLVLSENPSLTAADVVQRYHDYQNLNLTLYQGFPYSFDGTAHIDMWMLPVDDWKVIIGQYEPSDGSPYTITEGAVADLTARGYTVYRTPGWNSGGTHYTYTNAVIFNDLVFMSRFNVPQDNVALAVFQEAFPGKTIYQLDSSSIIQAAGAMHCITMHMPAAAGLYIGLAAAAPEFIAPQTPTPITVRIENRGETYVPGSGLLYYRFDGGAWLTAPLASLGDNVYEGLLPGAGCGDAPEFYFSATGDQGTVVYLPSDAPAQVYTATVATVTTLLSDDFESDLSWTVDSAPGMTSGMWTRAVPPGDDYGPDRDYDGSGRCYVTDSRRTYDVDGGPTHLTSPAFDMSAMHSPIVRFAEFFFCDDATVYPPTQDFLDVHLSSDGGATWVLAAQYASHDDWAMHEIRVADFIPLTATVQVRFTANDTPNNSQTEAGIDAVWIYDLACDAPWKLGDVNCDQAVNVFDIDPFVLALTDQAEYVATYPDCNVMNADTNGDGAINVFDIDPFVNLLTGAQP